MGMPATRKILWAYEAEESLVLAPHAHLCGSQEVNLCKPRENIILLLLSPMAARQISACPFPESQEL